jgi:hypothetical protein
MIVRNPAAPSIPATASRVPRWNSASPADARNLAVDHLAVDRLGSLPDGRFVRAAGSRCRNSRSSYLDRSLHRQRPEGGRRGHRGRHNRAYGRRRYRRHPRRIADAARIVDRAVESARIRRPRRNAAHAGILGRYSRRRRQKTQHRNGQQRRSAGHPSAREHRNRLRVVHGSVILSRLVISIGKNFEGHVEVPIVCGRLASDLSAP